MPYNIVNPSPEPRSDPETDDAEAEYQSISMLTAGCGVGGASSSALLVF